MSNSLGEKFKMIRQTTGLSANKFAEKVGIPLSSYKKYEAGDSEVGAPPLLAIANHTDFKQYALWLINGETSPAAGQIMPGQSINDEHVSSSSAISEQRYKAQFVEVVTDCIMTFGFFQWIKVDTEKMDFDKASEYVLNKVTPIIESRYTFQTARTKRKSNVG
ncbi:helix-turn-helix domain-containing protein [Pseudoalteromonas obscura]|uniref:Helix-turn-helix transcriptional regulator n=1 Tax=Pseudoalteromonas obscura TaxID=3048491 RepID=A0ABT7ES85_9GAMM|nr:helix-turn-helix transcriptional regulator [Pseudoalteromonas sp. P94(2023)]MDK2597926.1 helix-turn-helix transcriptional regulator [Pseudoalteromonas sp. P94(2023)]